MLRLIETHAIRLIRLKICTRLLFLVALISFFYSPLFAKEGVNRIILGLLEDVPGQHEGDGHHWAIRTAFEKIGSDWKSFQYDCENVKCLNEAAQFFPKEVDWTIAFDGKRIGELHSSIPDGYQYKTYAHIGHQEVTNISKIPKRGKVSSEFSGWDEIPVYRPLIAVSMPNVSDPDHWKPASLDAPMKEMFQSAYRKKFPTVMNCKNYEENIQKPWSYSNSDIKIVKAYTSQKKQTLAKVILTEYNCDGPVDEQFTGQWFVIGPEGEAVFLDQGMKLLDAGDYDNDGRSELIFMIDRYNTGGYEIFYDDFSKRSTFLFHYH